MPNDADRRLLVVLFALGAAAMLLGALGDREYSYYTLLRAAVCVAAVLVCVLAFRWRQLWAVGIFALIAVLFNPVVPINLSERLWRLIDVGAAGLFVLAAATVEPPGEGTVRRLARLPSRLLGKNVPSGVVIGMAIGLVLVPLGVVTYRMDLVSLYRWEAAGWEWRRDLAAYNALPTNVQEARTKRVQTRLQYRKGHPEVDAKLFIVGDVSSLATSEAFFIAVRLMKERRIQVSDIRGLMPQEFESSARTALRRRFEQALATKPGVPIAPWRGPPTPAPTIPWRGPPTPAPTIPWRGPP